MVMSQQQETLEKNTLVVTLPSFLKIVAPFAIVTFVIILVSVSISLSYRFKTIEKELAIQKDKNSQLLKDISKKRISCKNKNEANLIASGSASYAKNHYQALSELKSQLTNIFAGKFEYSKQNVHPDYPIPYYSKDIDLVYMKFSGNDREAAYESRRQILVSAFKYMPGMVADGGYEGSKWKVDMDAWVTYLNSLTTNTTKIKKVTWWGTDEIEYPIVVKRLANHNFGVYDGSFKPAGTTSRYFVTYDSVHGNIIQVEARDYFVTIEYQKDSAFHKYTADVEGFFSSVEDAIADLTSY